MEDNIMVGVFVWIVGIIVALVVGSGMIEKTLTVQGITPTITVIAGWIVVIGAIISVILAVFVK